MLQLESPLLVQARMPLLLDPVLVISSTVVVVPIAVGFLTCEVFIRESKSVKRQMLDSEFVNWYTAGLGSGMTGGKKENQH